jgi:uncharacterized protein (TIGR02284 family)
MEGVFKNHSISNKQLMQEDNLYRNLDKENTSSYVFHLFARNDEAATTYRRIATEVKDETLKEWFSELATYRQKLAQELRQLVEDTGSAPVRPSREMKSYLQRQEDEITRYINEEHTVGLIDISLETEELLGKYYQKAEANKNIPLPIRETLSKQHEQVLDMIRKARRLHTVPERK